MTIGAVYAVTYATMGMRFSALGSLGVAAMWSLIFLPLAGTARRPRERRSIRPLAVPAGASLRARDGTENEYTAPGQSAD